MEAGSKLGEHEPHANVGTSSPWLAYCCYWLCLVSLPDARYVLGLPYPSRVCLLAAIPLGQPGSQLARADAILASCQLEAGHKAYDCEVRGRAPSHPSLQSSPRRIGQM